MKSGRVIPAEDSEWDLVIKPMSGWFHVNIGELIEYRDLILIFIKRDFVTVYKQTILGPLWYIIQPVVNSIIFSIIFGKVAQIPTDGLPPFLFYMVGVVAWGYFAQCLVGTSNTFVSNAGLFGKVYFPRLVVPISVALTGLFQFAIQFLVLLGFYFYFWWHGVDVVPNYRLWALPLLLLQMMVLGVGVGTLISALTSKYRDLRFAMEFGVQLWMYLTPVVYPLSQVPERYRIFYVLNPMVAVVEFFRSALLGVSSLEFIHVVISVTVTIAIFCCGIVVFSRTEKTFMDTV